MTSVDCGLIAMSYAEWLRGEFTAGLADGSCRITTPFVDRHRNLLEVYAEGVSDGRVRLSDDGHVIRELAMDGVELSGERRDEWFQGILASHGVEYRDGELSVTVPLDAVGRRTHDLLQAMLAASDLAFLATPSAEAVFLDDVRVFLDSEGVRATPDIKITGASGWEQAFDYLVPRTKVAAERLLQVIPTPARPSFERLIFGWHDVRQVRTEPLEAFAIINDDPTPPVPDHLDALRRYDIHPVLWTQRAEYVGELVA